MRSTRGKHLLSQTSILRPTPADCCSQELDAGSNRARDRKLILQHHQGQPAFDDGGEACLNQVENAGFASCYAFKIRARKVIGVMCRGSMKTFASKLGSR